MRLKLTSKATIAVIAVLGVLAAIGVGYAAIPSTDGVIHSCYASPSGQLRVIDAETSSKCSKNEKELAFNQRGPKGDKGDPAASAFTARIVERDSTAPSPYYGAVTGISDGSLTAGPVTTLSPNTAMVARDLSVRYADAPDDRLGGWRITLLVDGVPTGLACEFRRGGRTCNSGGGFGDSAGRERASVPGGRPVRRRPRVGRRGSRDRLARDDALMDLRQAQPPRPEIRPKSSTSR